MVGADYGWSKSMVGTFLWLEHLWLEHFHGWSSLILMNQIMVGAQYGWSKSMVGADSLLEKYMVGAYGWSILMVGADLWLEQNVCDWSIPSPGRFRTGWSKNAPTKILVGENAQLE